MDLPAPGGGAMAAHEPRVSLEFQRGGTPAGEGKRVRLGVSEVGSSKERGCMM